MEGYNHIVCLFLCCFIGITQCELRAPLNGTFVSERLKSGPVFLIDSRTILVTRFFYDNGKLKNLRKIHNKWFKGVVRRGDNVLEFVDFEFANGTNAQLTANLYLAQNLYLHLSTRPRLSVRELSAVAIVNDKSRIKTAVEITPFDLENLPDVDEEYEYTKTNAFVFVYPKCCPLTHYCVNDTCIPGPAPDVRGVQRYAIHEKRMMRYQLQPIPTGAIHYEPFYQPNICASNELVPFDLNEDGITLLSNNELLVKDVSRPQLACMELALDEDRVLREKLFICREDTGLDVRIDTPQESAGLTIKPQSLEFLLLSIAIIVQIFKL